jgi:hypothetical protein
MPTDNPVSIDAKAVEELIAAGEECSMYCEAGMRQTPWAKALVAALPALRRVLTGYRPTTEQIREALEYPICPHCHLRQLEIRQDADAFRWVCPNCGTLGTSASIEARVFAALLASRAAQTEVVRLREGIKELRAAIKKHLDALEYTPQLYVPREAYGRSCALSQVKTDIDRIFREEN